VAGNPTLKTTIRKRLTSIIRKKKNLWVPHLWSIDPLKETATTLVLQKLTFFESH
jgi:hypothetical protein